MASSTAGSPVLAAMLNPALMAAITAASVEQYEAAAGEPMPWSLAFLVAPLVLHRDTREALPRRTNSHWATWISGQPVLHAGFAARAVSLVEPVRDGLRFAIANRVLVPAQRGGLSGGLIESSRPERTGDIAEVIRMSGFVGKWLTKLDRPATAFALLGVEP